MEVYILEDSHPTYVSWVMMDLPLLGIKKKVDKVSKWWLTGSCLWRCFVAENIGDTGLVEDTGKYRRHKFKRFLLSTGCFQTRKINTSRPGK